MGWNEPDKDKEKDPWNGKNQPPDLDEALKRLQNKLKKTFMGGSSKPTDGKSPTNTGGLLALMVFLVASLTPYPK